LERTIKIMTAEQKRLVKEPSRLSRVSRPSLSDPLLSFCQNLRFVQEHWNQLEAYISDLTGAEYIVGICPDRAIKMYYNY